MSIILHLARAELWRLRWWFLAWCLIQSLGFFGVYYAQPENTALSSLASGQTVLTPLWAFFLGLELWLWAAPQGAERFWATRPISLAQLLWSRLFVIGTILVLVPLGLSLPFWISWHLELVQYWKAAGYILLQHFGGLGAALLVCLVNPYMGHRNNRFLHALLTVVLIAVPVEFIGIWFTKQHLTRAIPLPVRQGIFFVALVAFLLALAVFFVRRSRALALTVLLVLPCLSVPLLYLIPVRTQPFPDSPKAIAALGGLENLEFGLLPVPRVATLFRAVRSDASAGPLSLSCNEASLVQEGRRVPIRGNWSTPRVRTRPNDVALYETGERRVTGSLYYDDGNNVSYSYSPESPLGMLLPDKPVTIQGRLIVTQLEVRKGRELLIGPEGVQEASEGMHLRRVSTRGPERVEVYTDYRPYFYFRDGQSSFRAVDAVTGELSRDHRSSSYSELTVLGVAWRSNRETFSPPISGQEQSSAAYRIIEYTEHRRDLGFATLNAPITIKRLEEQPVTATSTEGKK